MMMMIWNIEWVWRLCCVSFSLPVLKYFNDDCDSEIISFKTLCSDLATRIVQQNLVGFQIINCSIDFWKWRWRKSITVKSSLLFVIKPNYYYKATERGLIFQTYCHSLSIFIIQSMNCSMSQLLSDAYKFFIDVASISFYIFPCKLIFDTIYNEVTIYEHFMNISSLSLFNQQPRKCLKCIGVLGSSVPTFRNSALVESSQSEAWIQSTQAPLMMRVQFVMSVISINKIYYYICISFI